jgi:hypothetical protein
MTVGQLAQALARNGGPIQRPRSGGANAHSVARHMRRDTPDAPPDARMRETRGGLTPLNGHAPLATSAAAETSMQWPNTAACGALPACDRGKCREPVAALTVARRDQRADWLSNYSTVISMQPQP